MDFNEYRKHGKEMVDYIADYLENIRDRRVFPNVKPGYMRNLLPESAPVDGEDWSKIFVDIERVIMPGITHWQSPHMHAYFPALNSGPSLLGDMLADAINCLGFTWASSPACTELETITLNWLGKMIGLPDEFLHMGGNGQGGGVIQTTASEATLVCLLAGRTQAIRRFHEKSPGLQDSEINARLVAYCSDQAHSSVEKAALIGLVRMRFIESDDNLSMRGDALEDAIRDDIKLGLVPFWVCATLGTTGACAFDNLDEIGTVCMRHKMWLHVDAAYAGSAFCCPEYRIWLKGIEKADSLAFNPSKWLMVHFDCTAMWVKTSAALHRTFNVEPLYLQHENSGLAIDYMHWQIPLSKRFRSLKLWFVIRNYGIKGLQKHIREGVRLAQKLEALVLADQRFEIPAVRHLGMVVFRIKGGNDLTERLLKRLNHRGNLHCVPASLKGKYVIRFTITSSHTTNDDLLKDWAEVRLVTTELLEELNVKIGDRARVLLKETREKNEAFGSSLLLANSPMSPKIVNGSFAAIFDTDEFLAKAYAGIRMASQHSPAMRRRVKGILMSGKQFSLDSRMDLVVHGIDTGVRQTADADDDDDEVKNRAITEDGEEAWEACEASGESESTNTDSVRTEMFCHRMLNNCQPTCAANRVLSSTASTSSEEKTTIDQPEHQTSDPAAKATLQIVASSDLPLGNRKMNTICSETRKLVPSRPRMPKRNSRIDFQLLENNDACNIPADNCKLSPQIRSAFYNKGFEETSISRKFSLIKYELRSRALAMPNIDEYAGSLEDSNDSDNNNQWTSTRSADAIHLVNLNKSNYGGSSGRDITLLPRLKIRISDEMGKRVKSPFDGSTSSDENEFGKSFERRFAASDEEQLCDEHTTAPAVAITYDPFQCDAIRSEENVRKCRKCGHRYLCKQFSNSFQIEWNDVCFDYDFLPEMNCLEFINRDA